MKKYIYILIVISIILFAFVFKFSSFTGDLVKKSSHIIETDEEKYAREINDVLSKFDSLYTASVKESGAAGGAVVIVYKGHIVFTKCHGVKKAGENSLVDENTIFRLASVSKTISGVLAGILANEKIIDLDDKVVDYIPDFRLKLAESTNSITIRNLLSHTSGLTPYAFDGMVEDGVPLTEIIKRLNEVEITAPPGINYAYQNVMFSIYGLVVEEKTNQSFNAVIEQMVFKPFGMKNASIDFTSFENNNNKAYPHQKTGNGFISIPLNNRYYNTAPAAGINASISDLGHFLAAVSKKESSLLSAKEKEIIFTPQVETNLKRSYYRNWDNIDSKHYAIGWRIIDYKNHKIAQHGGYVAGYQSEIAVCEDEETGIAVLTNSPNSFFSNSVPTFLTLFFEHKKKLEEEKIMAEKSNTANP